MAEIDASLQVGGKDTFLPDAEGMYLVEGKNVRVMDQVRSNQGRQDADPGADSVSGADGAGKENDRCSGHACYSAVKSPTPEFYLRECPRP